MRKAQIKITRSFRAPTKPWFRGRTVASSNLASSSKDTPKFGLRSFLFIICFLWTGGTGNPSPTKLFVSTALNDPFARIIFDVLPYLVIILLVAYYMVVIRALEDDRPYLPMAKSFEGRNKMWNCHIGRGRRPRRPTGCSFVNLNE